MDIASFFNEDFYRRSVHFIFVVSNFGSNTTLILSLLNIYSADKVLENGWIFQLIDYTVWIYATWDP